MSGVPQCCAKCDLYVSLVSSLKTPSSAQINTNPNNCLETAVKIQSKKYSQIPVDGIEDLTPDPEVEATDMMENVHINCQNMDTRALDIKRESEAASEAVRVKAFEARLEAKYRETGIIPRSRPLLHSPSLKTIVKKPKITRTGAREFFRRFLHYKTGKFRPLPLALSSFPGSQDEDTFVLNI